ncbi:bifunctional DNA primase/polymerase [Rhizohabitans arisaemae]|uniref:bifunctional DNA primase/polymerase n=1 Tax=Rhizohabitans arisaemae TaxID=2720610 RepID=UPI0024B22CFB|nr:bifunctional DNA primase/polymerase [Rhizohabitans arisaemae]
MNTNPLLAAALALIARGRRVFPCQPGGKRPLGRLVPNGFHGASADSELVAWWWRQVPHANVAVPTGLGTVDVLDVDVKETGSGYPAFNRLKQAGLLPAPLAVISTPSGGLHCYYPGTGQSCGSLPACHLDFKAAGGYVLVPPSTVGGRRYTVLSRPGLTQNQLNWGEVRRFLDPPRPRTVRPASPPQSSGTGIPGLAAWLATQTKGNRNRGLFWACCRAVENGADEADLDQLVTVIVAQGLDEREARRTAADAFRLSGRR